MCMSIQFNFVSTAQHDNVQLSRWTLRSAHRGSTHWTAALNDENTAFIQHICAFFHHLSSSLCSQSLFTLTDKAWAGSNLLYKWQKTLGNYIAVSGWVSGAVLLSGSVFVHWKPRMCTVFHNTQTRQLCSNIWSTWTQAGWSQPSWVRATKSNDSELVMKSRWSFFPVSL